MRHTDGTALATELSVFKSHRSDWVRHHRGSYVAIHGRKIAGFFASYEEAFRQGLRVFGVGRDFLVKQVTEHEPVFFVS
jgi:hypothetical protein